MGTVSIILSLWYFGSINSLLVVISCHNGKKL